MAAIRRVDHIAIAVRHLEHSIALFENIFGAKLITKKRGMMQGHPMAVAYLLMGEDIIALDEAVDPDGFIAKFIDKRDEYIQELEAKGVRIPVKELDGEFRREILLSPREANGVVWQVIEWKSGPDLSLQERIERLHQYREVDEQRLAE
jgi:catechol 2,3-dioxygenase-like lactoylglutathione lyase family enzyme